MTEQTREIEPGNQNQRPLAPKKVSETYLDEHAVWALIKTYDSRGLSCSSKVNAKLFEVIEAKLADQGIVLVSGAKIKLASTKCKSCALMRELDEKLTDYVISIIKAYSSECKENSITRNPKKPDSPKIQGHPARLIKPSVKSRKALDKSPAFAKYSRK